MKLLKKYYENICKKKQEEIKKTWNQGIKVSYRWEDIVRDALATNKKI